MKLDRQLIKSLPKAELHCHLDGSLRISTIIDLAKQQKINLPTINETDLAKILVIKNKVDNLDKYLDRFSITLSVLQTPNSLTRSAYELAEDSKNDGVEYIEIRYSPILHNKKGMTPAESIESVRKGLKQAEKDFNIKTGIIICGIRNVSPEISLSLAKLAIKYKNKGVVGFDLAGSEENFPAKKHRQAFYLIQNNNINSTLHAGEEFGPSSIHQAIHYCSANRIGHGTKLHEDKGLMDYINNHRIALEICLSSNLHTQSVESIEKHPFKKYFDEDIRVTLNTDNRLISNTTLTNEYYLAAKAFNLSSHHLQRLIINGFKSAFLPHKERCKLINKALDKISSILH